MVGQEIEPMSAVDREIDVTSFWGKVLFGTILIPTLGGFIYVGSLENRVTTVEKEVREIKLELNDLEDDIRAILVGIEQLKARLGIIESDK